MKPGIFSKKSQASNFITIRPVGAELFHEDRHRRTDMTALRVVFRNFAKAPPPPNKKRKRKYCISIFQLARCLRCQVTSNPLSTLSITQLFAALEY